MFLVDTCVRLLHFVLTIVQEWKSHIHILWHLREVISRKYVALKTEQIKEEITYIHTMKYSVSKLVFFLISQLHARTLLKNLTAAEVDTSFPFISVINKLDAQHFCFTISLFHASTCFEHIVKQKFCASSWLITEINILRCTVRKTSEWISHFHNGRQMIPILKRKNSVDPFPSYLFKIHFNITLPFTLKSFTFLELCTCITFFSSLLKIGCELIS